MGIHKFVLVLVTATMLLTACGESVDVTIYGHLEEAVTLEQDYEEQQEKIADLESQEQEIYNQIIDLGMDDFEQIKDLSNDALTIINERKERIYLEKESIETSKEEFYKVESLIPEIEEDDVKQKAEDMYDIMEKRYQTYDELYQAYSDSLILEEELYTMLQSEEIKQEEITEQIEQINLSYETILEVNEIFNEYTVQYNDLKKEYYDVADINVKYKE